MRALLLAGVWLDAIASATAQTTLRVGDQKGHSQAVMEAESLIKNKLDAADVVDRSFAGAIGKGAGL